MVYEAKSQFLWKHLDGKIEIIQHPITFGPLICRANNSNLATMSSLALRWQAPDGEISHF